MAKPRSLAEDGLDYMDSNSGGFKSPERSSYYSELNESSTATRPAANSDTERSRSKRKMTVELTNELIERVKNAAYWNPRLTISGIVEEGVQFAIQQIESENGGAYPNREAELKGGRPVK